MVNLGVDYILVWSTQVGKTPAWIGAKKLVLPPTRILIIHGQNDEVVPLKNSRSYVASYQDQTQLVEVDSDHRLNDQLDLIWEHVRSFLLG